MPSLRDFLELAALGVFLAMVLFFASLGNPILP